jgi:hypothetical protein
MTAQQHLHVSSLRMEPRGQSGSNSPTSGAHRRCHRDSERKRAVVTRLLQDLPNLIRQTHARAVGSALILQVKHFGLPVHEIGPPQLGRFEPAQQLLVLTALHERMVLPQEALSRNALASGLCDGCGNRG